MPSHDSWSRIQKTIEAGNDHNFFSVRSAAPTIQDLPDYIGFSCDRKTDAKIVRDFGEHLKFFARVSKVSAKKEGKFWIIKVRLLCGSDSSLINKVVNFQGVSFTPTSLKITDRKRDTLSRLLSGDRSLFEIGSVGQIKTFSTDSVFCRYTVTDNNDIHCLYKLRQIKENGTIVQEYSPFWMFISLYEDGTVSQSEEMKDIDLTNRGADITLERLIGTRPNKTDWNEKHYQQGVSGFHKEMNPTNPLPNLVKECVGIFKGEDDKECFPKLGKNCLPIGIKALKAGREMARGKDLQFWDNVTIDKVQEEVYLERQKKKTGFGRKKKEKLRVIDLQLSE